MHWTHSIPWMFSLQWFVTSFHAIVRPLQWCNVFIPIQIRRIAMNACCHFPLKMPLECSDAIMQWSVRIAEIWYHAMHLHSHCSDSVKGNVDTIVLPSAVEGGDLWQRSFGICAGKMVSPEDTKRGTLNSYQSCRPRSWLYLVHERRSVWCSPFPGVSERRTDGVGPPSRLGLEHGFVGLVLFMSKHISECSPLSVQNVFAVQCILLIRSHHQVG